MGDEQHFICWGDDREDLTERVRTVLAEPPRPVLHFVGRVASLVRRGRSQVRKITIPCSHGHMNVFEL